MPRPLRDRAAGTFHVFTHCLWAVPHLYRDTTDRIEFLRYLSLVTAKTEWTCIAYCLMATHYHLLVSVGDDVLPRAMHGLNLRYAREYNRRYGLRGHVQFERYGSRRIVDDADLLRTFRYVVNNPVEAGLCASAAEWQWSSYPGTVGVRELSSFVDPARLLRAWRWPDVAPVAALRAFVENA